MAHSPVHPAPSTAAPLVLVVPGLNNSGPGHWQTIWEETRGDCQRVDLGMWERPHRNTWINQLNLAVRQADRPVILAAHSLGCLAVAWWAALERPGADSPVLGALLVAPPEVDHRAHDSRVCTFAPTPSAPLPFPAILVGSHNDPYMGFRAARRLARTWGCSFADAGRVGHINADSGLGEWHFGQFLLEQLIKRAARPDRAGAFLPSDRHAQPPVAQPPVAPPPVAQPPAMDLDA